MSKNTFSSIHVTIRPARIVDLPGIMEIEREEFGDGIGADAMAAEKVMADRIRRCNNKYRTWFWVASAEKKIVGYMIAQPTNITSETCTSWGQATDEGSMNRTFSVRGRNIYIVSLGVKSSAPEKTGARLIEESVRAWKKSGKKDYMFCARMPGYRQENEKNPVDPEHYWRQRGPDDGPKDGMLHWFWRIFDAEPMRLLKNGFPPDKDSGGHGVLFVIRDPDRALQALSREVSAISTA